MSNTTSNKWRSANFQKQWLWVTGFVVASFAPIFFLSSMESGQFMGEWTLDLLSFPLDDNMPFNDSTRFLIAITGGLILGWRMLIWMLRAKVFDLAPNLVRQCVLISLISWFILDSSGSVLSGNPSNVLFNLGILLLGVGPLWFKTEEN
ncbi:MAG: hypothetical protein HRT74_04980 [Flavobacteriales bacterium]|nr:hypothetical protein [Flavobacteriales bacterium]